MEHHSRLNTTKNILYFFKQIPYLGCVLVKTMIIAGRIILGAAAFIAGLRVGLHVALFNAFASQLIPLLPAAIRRIIGGAR